MKGTKKRRDLWTLYADHVIEVWKNLGITNNTIYSFIDETMKRVFHNAHDIRALHKEHYVYWVCLPN